MAAFEEMGVMPEISKAVEEMDWLLPTDIQAESIPLILGGGDILMAAETGSGKTGAFSIPIIQVVQETLKDEQNPKIRKAGVSATISKWQINPYDRGPSLAVSPDGLLIQCREQKEWHGGRSTKGLVNKGKYYYEATVTDEGLCRVGFSTSKATLDLGTDKNSFGFGGTGKKSFGRQFDTYGEPFGKNDTIGCYLDLDNGTISYSKNGNDLGIAFEIPPHLRKQPIFAAVVLKNGEMQFNFGDTAFNHPPKGNYLGLARAPEDCVVKSANTAGGEAKGGVASSHSKPQPNAPKALIIEPSRELAEQTLNNVKMFKKHINDPPIRELLIIGGVPVRDQLQILDSGVDIVVGTPGRLEELISTGKLLLSQVRFFVLDECDGLLSAGYGQFIQRLHDSMTKVFADGKRLQMIVCSATLHSFDVKKMAEKLMYFPVWVDLKGEDSVPETVHAVITKVDPVRDTYWQHCGRNHVETDGIHNKDNVHPGNNTPETLSEAVKILKGEYTVRAIKEHKMDMGIIFCRTKLDCDNMERYFIRMGGGPNSSGHQFSCVCLHGDRKPPERKKNLQMFKDRKVRFLICTDVAARGLDVKGIPYVINVTLPPSDEKQNYVHRIGRVGRADRMGLAISFVSTVKEKVWYHGCPSRGRGCYNTRLTSQGGCAIWFDEPQYMADIEEHLGVIIQQVEADMKVPVDEFDGKVVYGQKRKAGGGMYKGHAAQLAPTVSELAELERMAQTSYLNLRENQQTLFKL
ncbi:ATP-dependent RNA helicase DDX1-like isoform X1 [Branchiostoma lanceolatum]|uniref:ATP-dependent RNA helicase DDX1-like isoform X1 n=1 Tax=Branchiostoma lanceolatum TaxID=7740 RepID=UPI003456CDB1